MRLRSVNAFLSVLFILSAVSAAVMLIIGVKKQSKRAGIFSAVCAVICVGFFIGCIFCTGDSAQTDKNAAFSPEVKREYEREDFTARPVKSEEGTQRSVQVNNIDSEETVYITRTGTKFHLSEECANGKCTEYTLSEALEQGYEPCAKCAQ